jgi:predicted nucleotide-binding protein
MSESATLPVGIIQILHDFMGVARELPHSEILKNFLRLVTFGGKICESRSILIYRSSDSKLHLFNDDGFLFKEKLLDPNKKWKSEFDLFDTLAGLTFQMKKLAWENDFPHSKYYVPDTDLGEIRTMLCAPIKIRTTLFGVANFHNKDPAKVFAENVITTIKVCMSALQLALEASPEHMSKNLFIVHGRDKDALAALRLILLERGITPITLGEQAHTGAELLQKLDEIVAGCFAGFVLFTPDDEGRLRPAESRHSKSKTSRQLKAGEPGLRYRARQNVVFEAGYLSKIFRAKERICFLRVDGDKATEMPSDLIGILYEEFDPREPKINRIEAVLRKWGLEWAPANARN